MKIYTILVLILLIIPIVYSMQETSSTNNDTVTVLIKLKSDNQKFQPLKHSDTKFTTSNKNKLKQNEVLSIINTTKVKNYDKFNIIVANISKDQLKKLKQNKNIESITIDSNKYKLLLDHSSPSIKPTSFYNLNYKGGLIDVAVIDTGILMNHPALSKTIDGNSRTFESYNTLVYGNINDDNGHGTHVAGIISSSDSTYQGIASGIKNLLNVKVFDEYGIGYDSDIIDGLNWALNNATDPAEVLSNSWGAAYKDAYDNCSISLWNIPNGQDSLTKLIDDLAINYPVSIIFASGNDGFCGDTTINIPGDAYNVITVGSIDDKDTNTRSDDIISSFSSKGPTLDNRKKPDVVAPGSNIISTSNTGLYESMNGTSMATPHVSGAIALILESGKTPLEAKALLINTAEDKGTTSWDNEYGWGYIDLETAANKLNFTKQDNISDYNLYLVNLTTNDKSTITWYRYNNNLNDLNLYLYNQDTNSIIDSSTSQIDNVEQVISNSNLNSAILKVKINESNTNEYYGLSSYKELTSISKPELTISLNISDIINESDNIEAYATITNPNKIKLYNLNLSFNLTEGLSANQIIISNLDANSSTTIPLNLTYTTIGNKTIIANILSSSYGESISSSTNKTINILDDDTTAPIISNISYNSSIFTYENLTINANFQDENGIYSKKVYYDYENDSIIEGSINFTDSTATIPAPGKSYRNTKLAFIIEAVDNDSDRQNDKTSINTSKYYVDILNSKVIISTYTPTNLNQNINENQFIEFTIGATDNDQDTIIYTWKLNNTLVSTTNNYNYTTNYDSSGNYKLELTASDVLSNDSISWNIQVNNVNRKPIANAGSDKSATVNNKITLSGDLSSDPDSNALTYSWYKSSGSDLTIDNLNNKSITFTPTEIGTYIFRLIVNDGTLDSVEDEIILTIKSKSSSGGGGGGSSKPKVIDTTIIQPTQQLPSQIAIHKENLQQKQIESNNPPEKSQSKTGLESITGSTIKDNKNNFIVDLATSINKLFYKIFDYLKNLF